MVNLLTPVLLCIVATATLVTSDPGDKWSVLKTFSFASIDQVRNDWNIALWGPGRVNNELEAYVDSPENIFVQDGILNVRAVRKQGSCAYYPDMDVGGQVMMEILTATKEDCCAACQKAPGCKGFVFVRSNAACYLKPQAGLYPHKGRVGGACVDFTSGRLESKPKFTPINSPGKKLKVEYVAQVPTVKGAWPALWLLGIDGVYGNWPQEGEIDIMEWVWQIQNDTKASLHWAGGNDWSTDFTMQSMAEVAAQWTTYGVEYSALPGDEYIQFYVKTQSGKMFMGKRATPDLWQNNWSPNPPCSQYTQSKGPCTRLAPFDNQVYAIINLAVGGQWGGCCGVNGDYSAFDKGVSMYVKSLVVYQNAYIPTTPGPTVPSPKVNWKLVKNYDLTNIASIKNDWDFVLWPTGKVNGEFEAYVDSPQNLFVANNAMNIKAMITPNNGQCQILGEYDIGYGANLATHSKTPQNQCCSLCAKTKGCLAWVWMDYLGGTCWLKDTLVGISAKPQVTAGIMGQFTSTRLSSKMKWSPTQPTAGGKLRVEITAKIPTVPGAWPAIWMLGISDVYGVWPHLGEIDLMEWVYQLRDRTQATLHWKSGNEDWGTQWNELSYKQMASEWATWGVQYSGEAGNEWVQFFIKAQGGNYIYSPIATPDKWRSSWTSTPKCQSITPGAKTCSPLAPFDNYMNIILNLAVGGNWGGIGAHDYSPFVQGVVYPIQSVKVFRGQ